MIEIQQRTTIKDYRKFSVVKHYVLRHICRQLTQPKDYKHRDTAAIQHLMNRYVCIIEVIMQGQLNVMLKK